MNGRPKTDWKGSCPSFVTDDPADGKITKWEIEDYPMERKGVSFEELHKEFRRLRLTFRGDCRMICTPMYTTSVQDIVSYIENLEYYDNFRADAIVIDYADLIKPSNKSGTEVRHQLNDIWMNLRNLAMTRNVLIMTATQTNRAGLNKDLDGSEIAEDLRKMANVSILFGLNQTKSERERGIMRITPLYNRDEKIYNDQAVVLQNLHCGRFYLDSRFRKDVEYSENDGNKEE
jgi:hypothetical protein